jgi:hypothetical protein
MSAARTALLSLVSALSEAAEPAPVALEDGPDPVTPPRPGVSLRPVALSRLGRSTRDGVLLDLELLARVAVSGPDALETTERLLVGLERDSKYVVEPLPPVPAGPAALGFDVRVRVPVRLEQPSGPPVREPMHVDLRPARQVAGQVLDADGGGIADALVRAGIGGRPVATDAEGRFRILVAEAPVQEFVIEVRGATRTVDARTQQSPVVIRWE